MGQKIPRRLHILRILQIMKVCGNICNAAVIKFVYFIRVALEVHMPKNKLALTRGGHGSRWV